MLDAAGASGTLDWHVMLLSLVLAFVLGHIIAWAYVFTHSGLSYSRTFVQSLVVFPIILSLVIMVLANNMVTAFGLMGAVAIIRFRNILKDTRDTAFLLLSLVIGLAVGNQRHIIAAVGTLAMCAVVMLLYYTSFGTRHRFDVILSFRLAGGARGLDALQPVLYRHCRKAVLASQRVTEAADAGDFSYRLLLRDPSRTAELLEELGASEGISRISVIQRDDEAEA
jgi:hypothetical protein